MKCNKCKSEMKIIYGTLSTNDNLTLKRAAVLFKCDKCGKEKSIYKSMDGLVEKLIRTYESIYCGSHSGFRPCCIAWHAFLYQHWNESGGLRGKLARIYFGKINSKKYSKKMATHTLSVLFYK